MARTWSAVLARLGVPTGDGRIISEGGGSSRDLPLPLLYQQQTSDGHGGSIVVGRMETMRIGDGMVTATGTLLDSAPADAVEQLEAGVIGPSVDLDDIEYVMDDMERLVITRWRVAGATLVAIPAFADVSLTLDPVPAADPDYVPTAVAEDAHLFMTASVRSSGWSDMPIADESRAWDGQAAADRVFSWATDGDTTDWSKYARAFLRKDDDANPETRGAYGFGIADVIDGTLTIVPRGVFAAAAATQGSRSGSAPEDADAMKRVLRGIYGRMEREAPFILAPAVMEEQFPKYTDQQVEWWDALNASAAAPAPPIEWFQRPELAGLTPLTVTPEGRVFGHVAGWGTCHVGLPGCVTPPSSPSGYSYFHVGEQRTAEGAVIPVGTLTVGGGHADAQLGFRAAAEHYDNVGAAVARVVAYEDEHGIAVAGWMLPGADPVRREQFMSSPVSGDWRRVAGGLELIAVCSVNSPGFPVPRARVAFSNGAQRALVGTFGMRPVEGDDLRGTPNAIMSTESDKAAAQWAWATRKEV